jgi:hypothetical protein
VVRENAGRATHDQHPFGYEQVRGKWKRILENTAHAQVEAGSFAAPSSTKQHVVHSNNNRGGRGGTAVRGRGAGGRGASGSTRITPRSNWQGPAATLHGLRACFGFNDSRNPCTRKMRDANTCMEPGPNGNVYIHCCNHFDPVSKKHCLSLAHGRHNGGH